MHHATSAQNGTLSIEGVTLETTHTIWYTLLRV